MKQIKLILPCLSILFFINTALFCQNIPKDFNFQDHLFCKNNLPDLRKLKVKKEFKISNLPNSDLQKNDTTKITFFSQSGLVDSILEKKVFLNSIASDFSLKTFYKYDEKGNCIDTNDTHIIQHKFNDNKSYTHSFGDTLTVIYDQFDNEIGRTVTKIDSENNLFHHYYLNKKSDKVEFSNILIFNKDGNLTSTTVFSKHSNSYSIYFFYDDRGRRIKEVRYNENQVPAYTTEYSYLENGLLSMVTSSDFKIKYQYEYY